MTPAGRPPIGCMCSTGHWHVLFEMGIMTQWHTTWTRVIKGLQSSLYQLLRAEWTHSPQRPKPAYLIFTEVWLCQTSILLFILCGKLPGVGLCVEYSPPLHQWLIYSTPGYSIGDHSPHQTHLEWQCYFGVGHSIWSLWWLCVKRAGAEGWCIYSARQRLITSQRTVCLPLVNSLY